MARPTLHQGVSGNKGTALGDAILLWRNYIGLPPAANETHYDFGPSTATATKKWQASNGLTADGTVGPVTWAKYDAIQAGQYGPPTAAEAVAQQAAAAISKAANIPTSAAVASRAVAQAASATATVPASAHAAAAALAGKAPLPTVTSPTTAPVGLRDKVHAAETGILHEVETLYNKIPLWARIGLGTFSALLTIVGIKKVIHK